MDLNALFGAVGAAKSAVDLLKTSVAARDQAKADEAIADAKKNLAIAYDSLLSVSQQSLELYKQVASAEQRINELRQENQRLAAEIEDRKRYVLTDIGGGIKAYAFQPVDGEADAAHYLCQPCMAKGHKSVLQPHGPRRNFKCHACDSVYISEPLTIPSSPLPRTTNFWES
ncbi:DUF4164 domain-containing protein [Herbaspirillum sp. C7C8]|uniref:DUF4164 domain-containing protein n=1 Tax=Herbaspirillum sp. C7C8 TaxID=2736665 RepID=UPI001F52991E|nr:DUF4164 domain-containing protein [Herbaspirillum sp. C7C8]MCI1005228.1 hypothetical protein [Herbaspirillum sp. C7C8]